MLGFFFRTIAEKDADYDLRQRGRIPDTDSYYAGGDVDPRTGRKLPARFMKTMAYKAGNPIEETCWGEDGNWWEVEE